MLLLLLLPLLACRGWGCQVVTLYIVNGVLSAVGSILLLLVTAKDKQLRAHPGYVSSLIPVAVSWKALPLRYLCDSVY